MKIKKIRNNYALEYAFYMMAGSYFRKADCNRSHHQESRLRLYYQEETRDSQYLMEDFAIHYMEDFLMEKVPERIWKEKVSAHLTRSKDSDATTIQFRNAKVDMKLTLKLMGDLKVCVDCELCWLGHEVLNTQTEVFCSKSGKKYPGGEGSSSGKITCRDLPEGGNKEGRGKEETPRRIRRSYISSWHAA